MKAVPVVLLALAVTLPAAPARAEGCSRSLERVLDGSRELAQKPQDYRALLPVCLEAAQMSNVKDAFILESGAIAVVPRKSGVMATAGTLSQFCARFPKGRLQFVTDTPRPGARAAGTPASCEKVLGH